MYMSKPSKFLYHSKNLDWIQLARRFAHFPAWRPGTFVASRGNVRQRRLRPLAVNALARCGGSSWRFLGHGEKMARVFWDDQCRRSTYNVYNIYIYLYVYIYIFTYIHIYLCTVEKRMDLLRFYRKVSCLFVYLHICLGFLLSPLSFHFKKRLHATLPRGADAPLPGAGIQEEQHDWWVHAHGHATLIADDGRVEIFRESKGTMKTHGRFRAIRAGDFLGVLRGIGGVPFRFPWWDISAVLGSEKFFF